MKMALSTPAAERPPTADLAASELTPSKNPSNGLPAGVDLLARLESLCAGRGLDGLAERLHDLATFIGYDMLTFEETFGQLPRDPRLVGRAATRLLDLGGKRLRPMCLALASRLGSGFDSRGLDLAVAVELVHSATLLHDDVVDVSDERRGSATARTIYGNAASIFAGDWLLIEALRRVERSRCSGLLVELFDIIEEMIFAESLQLESRGRLGTGRDTYFRVVEGKTASLFRWAMRAGGTAGGLDEMQLEALGDYGLYLGVAFQATDDLLDLTGDSLRTGKALFTDLREGKMTYPMIIALERDESLRPVVEEVLATPADEPFCDELTARVVEALHETRAVEECLNLARDRSARAVASLEMVPEGRARDALVTVAESIVDRDL